MSPTMPPLREAQRLLSFAVPPELEDLSPTSDAIPRKSLSPAILIPGSDSRMPHLSECVFEAVGLEVAVRAWWRGAPGRCGREEDWLRNTVAGGVVSGNLARLLRAGVPDRVIRGGLELGQFLQDSRAWHAWSNISPDKDPVGCLVAELFRRYDVLAPSPKFEDDGPQRQPCLVLEPRTPSSPSASRSPFSKVYPSWRSTGTPKFAQQRYPSTPKSPRLFWPSKERPPTGSSSQSTTHEAFDDVKPQRPPAIQGLSLLASNSPPQISKPAASHSPTGMRLPVACLNGVPRDRPAPLRLLPTSHSERSPAHALPAAAASKAPTTPGHSSGRSATPRRQFRRSQTYFAPARVPVCEEEPEKPEQVAWARSKARKPTEISNFCKWLAMIKSSSKTPASEDNSSSNQKDFLSGLLDNSLLGGFAGSKTDRKVVRDLDELRRIFDFFDKDASGAIEPGEFLALLSKLTHQHPKSMDKKEVWKCWDSVDIDGSGQISFDEFQRWYCDLFSIDDHPDLSELFGEDNLTPEQKQIRDVAHKLKLPNLDVESIHKEFMKLDQDGNGFLEKKEFKVLIQSQLAPSGTPEVPATVIDRFWVEVSEGKGDVTFEIFAQWYSQAFQGGASMDNFYHNLGSGSRGKAAAHRQPDSRLSKFSMSMS